MDATPLETVQVEASVFQKEQIINGKDAGGHGAGGGTELDHNGPKHLDQFRGNVSNGKSALLCWVYDHSRYCLQFKGYALSVCIAVSLDIYISMKWA